MNTLKGYVNYKLTHADKVAEAEGYPLKLENCKKYKKMRDLKVYGNSVQDGTPTPDAPIEVQSVGDLTKNLFNENKFLDMSRINSNENEWYMTNDALHDANRSYSDDITFKENTQYTIGMIAKCTGGGGRFKVVYTDGTTSYVTAPSTEYTTITYVTTANKTISYIGGHYNYNGTFYIQKNSMFLYEGTGVTKYEPYGKYKIPVIARGKNLATAYEVFKNFSDYTKLEEDARQCIRIKSNGKPYAIFDFTFKENTQYTISFEFKCKYDRSGVSLPYDVPFAVYYTDGNIDHCSIQPINNTWNKRVLTTKAGKTISHIQAIGFDYRVYTYIDVNTFQIAEGTATGYEPYIEPQTTSIYLTEPLRKVGVYADYIDFKNNKVVRNIGVGTSNSLSKWRDEGNYNCGIAWGLPNCNYRAKIALCTHLKYWILSNGVYFQFIDAIYWYFDKTLFPTKADADKWIASRKADEIPLRFHYVFTTPTEEPLNIDLPKLTTKTTIIEVDTSLAPSNAYGKYIKK